MGGVGAIIAAAGTSQRMGGVDKLLQPLAGRPLVAHAIEAFASHPAIEHLAVVVSPANEGAVRALVVELTPRARANMVVLTGGARRRDSVLAGLDTVAHLGCDLAVIHDGARPLVTASMIDAVIAGARRGGAALCAVPVSDTIKRVEDNGLVRGTVSREGLWLAQTPQAFELELLRRAHAATDIDATDDAALVELIGAPVLVVPGSAANLKVTLLADLQLAEALLAALQQATGSRQQGPDE
jgi:2-C-methyl-D-erythritol 4-phosphate cytidylyltransferase